MATTPKTVAHLLRAQLSARTVEAAIRNWLDVAAHLMQFTEAAATGAKAPVRALVPVEKLNGILGLPPAG